MPVLLLLLAVAGATVPPYLRRRATSVAATYTAQLPPIHAALNAAPPGFLLLAGDSHTLILSRTPPAGLHVVNATIGGIRAREYVHVAGQLAPSARAGMAIVSLGTNHLRRKNRPGELHRVATFRRDVDQVLAALADWTDQLIVLAVPPIGAPVVAQYDLDAVHTYSATLAAACEALQTCRFVDPYRELRGDTFGLARPGAMADGIHVSDPASVWAALAGACLGTRHAEGGPQPAFVLNAAIRQAPR